MDTINKKTTSQMGNQDDIHLFAERGGEGRGGGHSFRIYRWVEDCFVRGVIINRAGREWKPFMNPL